jgi:uncharacterized membrane-anchored protein
MPGAIPHVIAGCSMYIIGKYHFKSYFDGEGKTKERFLLLLVCLLFSFLPDFILIIYSVTRTSPSHIVFWLHGLFHLATFLMAIAILIVLKYDINVKREYIGIMGMWSIILHVIMDSLIPEYGIWI